MSDYKLPISYEDAELDEPGYNILDADNVCIAFADNLEAAKLIVDYVNGFGEKVTETDEEIKRNYLIDAKYHQEDAGRGNSRPVEAAISCSLIAIAERLDKQNELLERIVGKMESLTWILKWGRG